MCFIRGCANFPLLLCVLLQALLPIGCLPAINQNELMEVVADPLVTILGISSQNPKSTENSNQMVDSQQPVEIQATESATRQDERAEIEKSTQATLTSQERESQQVEVEKSVQANQEASPSQKRESQQPGQDEIEKPMQATQETPLSQEHEGQEPGQEEIEKSEQNQRKPLQEQKTEFEQPTEIQTADQATLGSKQATVVKAKAEAEAEAAAKAEGMAEVKAAARDAAKAEVRAEAEAEAEKGTAKTESTAENGVLKAGKNALKQAAEIQKSEQTVHGSDQATQIQKSEQTMESTQANPTAEQIGNSGQTSKSEPTAEIQKSKKSVDAQPEDRTLLSSKAHVLWRRITSLIEGDDDDDGDDNDSKLKTHHIALIVLGVAIGGLTLLCCISACMFGMWWRQPSTKSFGRRMWLPEKRVSRHDLLSDDMDIKSIKRASSLPHRIGRPSTKKQGSLARFSPHSSEKT